MNDEIQRYAAAEIQRADEIRSQEAQNEYDRLMIDAVAQEKDQNRLGDSIGATDRIRMREQEIREQVGGKLQGRQAEMFRQYADRAYVRTHGNMTGHEMLQIREHDTIQYNSSMELALQMVDPARGLAIPGDNEELVTKTYLSGVDQLVGEKVRMYAERNDWSAEKTAAEIAKQQSRYHLASMERLVAQGQNLNMTKYFEAYKDQIFGPERTKAERMANEGAVLGKALAIVDDIDSRMVIMGLQDDTGFGGEMRKLNHEEALDIVREVEDPRVRIEATRQLHARWSEDAEAKKIDENDRMKRIVDRVLADPTATLSDVMPLHEANSMTETEIRQVKNVMRAARESRYSDDGLARAEEIRRQMREDPQGPAILMTMMLTDDERLLGNMDAWSELYTLQQKMFAQGGLFGQGGGVSRKVGMGAESKWESTFIAIADEKLPIFGIKKPSGKSYSNASASKKYNMSLAFLRSKIRAENRYQGGNSENMVLTRESMENIIHQWSRVIGEGKVEITDENRFKSIYDEDSLAIQRLQVVRMTKTDLYKRALKMAQQQNVIPTVHTDEFYGLVRDLELAQVAEELMNLGPDTPPDKMEALLDAVMDMPVEDQKHAFTPDGMSIHRAKQLSIINERVAAPEYADRALKQLQSDPEEWQKYQLDPYSLQGAVRDTMKRMMLDDIVSGVMTQEADPYILGLLFNFGDDVDDLKHNKEITEAFQKWATPRMMQAQAHRHDRTFTPQEAIENPKKFLRRAWSWSQQADFVTRFETGKNPDGSNFDRNGFESIWGIRWQRGHVYRFLTEKSGFFMSGQDANLEYLRQARKTAGIPADMPERFQGLRLADQKLFEERE
jgi:hypothetical protein